MYRNETRILDDVFSFLILERLYRSVGMDRETGFAGARREPETEGTAPSRNDTMARNYS